MFVSELKGLDQTKGLLNRASNWEVVDGDLSQDAVVVNNEQAPEMELWHLKMSPNIDFVISNIYRLMKISNNTTL